MIEIRTTSIVVKTTRWVPMAEASSYPACELKPVPSPLPLPALASTSFPSRGTSSSRWRGVLLRLLALARAPGELAEAEVAVGDEGAHAARRGQDQRLAIVAFGRGDGRRLTMGGDLAEPAERPRLG